MQHSRLYCVFFCHTTRIRFARFIPPFCFVLFFFSFLFVTNNINEHTAHYNNNNALNICVYTYLYIIVYVFSECKTIRAQEVEKNAIKNAANNITEVPTTLPYIIYLYYNVMIPVCEIYYIPAEHGGA